MKKIIKENEKKFYLYNPIPIVKQEASEVIKRILNAHNISFQFGETVNLNELDTVNKMRMRDYINRVIKYKEVRGHAIEGLMVGLFDGQFNKEQMGSWDYMVRQGTVEQKYIEDINESPSIGAFKNIIDGLPQKDSDEIRNILSKYESQNIFLINDPELEKYKRNILETMLTDIICVTTKSLTKLVNYYFTKEDFISYAIDAKNIAAPKNKNSLQLRIKSGLLTSKANKFEIIIPSISQKEYDDYMKEDSEEIRISKIFGPYYNKIRPDILKWIKNNKDLFKDSVNQL
jgi:hypothetical protein